MLTHVASCRAEIAYQLLPSPDEGADAGAAEAWIAELEQRAREARSGSAATEERATVKARPIELGNAFVARLGELLSHRH